jgi:RNA polymerase sigma factor (sigma-70 family)
MQSDRDEDSPLRRWLAEHDANLIQSLLPLVRTLCDTPRECEEEARDLMVETVKIALAKEADFDPSRSVQGYLFGIARNVARQRWANRKRERDRLVYADMPLSDDGGINLWERLRAAQTESTEDIVMRREWVANALALASEDDRQILYLSIVEGLTGAEMAAALNTTAGNVRVQKCRATNRLSKKMAQEEVNALNILSANYRGGIR